MGLGDEAVIAVPCDQLRQMRTSALASQLAQVKRDGLIPMTVVATAGTTDFGSIDPLPAISALCASAAVWLHVDAAYGLVYMPHGENVILVLDDVGNVRRILFKDIAEVIAVLDPATPLPPGVDRIRAEVPDE